MNRREPAYEHRRLSDAQRAAQCSEERQQRQRLPQRGARHQGDPYERHEGPRHSHDAQTLLALKHGEQQRRERHQREEDRTEPGVQLDEGVIPEGEGPAYVEEPEQDRTGQRPSARQLQPQYRHRPYEHGRRQSKPQACSP
jgi:hypothetical protein